MGNLVTNWRSTVLRPFYDSKNQKKPFKQCLNYSIWPLSCHWHQHSGVTIVKQPQIIPHVTLRQKYFVQVVLISTVAITQDTVCQNSILGERMIMVIHVQGCAHLLAIRLPEIFHVLLRRMVMDVLCHQSALKIGSIATGPW